MHLGNEEYILKTKIGLACVDDFKSTLKMPQIIDREAAESFYNPPSCPYRTIPADKPQHCLSLCCLFLSMQIIQWCIQIKRQSLKVLSSSVCPCDVW